MDSQSRRVEHHLTSDDRKRLEGLRKQLRKNARNARDENTLSGEIRRAVNTSDLSLTTIARRSGLTPLELDEFLTSERTLPSDALDRLSEQLGCS